MKHVCNQSIAYILIAVYKIPRYITTRAACMCCTDAFNARCYSMAWVHIPSGTVGRLDDVIGHGQWWPSRLPSTFVARLLSSKLTANHGHQKTGIVLIFLGESYAKYILVLTGCQSRPCRLAIRGFISFTCVAAWQLGSSSAPRECVKKQTSPRYTKTRDT